MNGWDQVDELAKRDEQSSGGWLRLVNDGDTAVVVFLGEPYPREVCFIDGKYAPATPELKAKGAKSTTRVAINVALLPSLEVKKYDMALRGLYRDVRAVAKKFALDSWAYEITRHGGPNDPSTTYTVLPEVQLTPEQKRAVAQLPLKDLAQAYGGRGDAGAAGGAGFDEPIDAATLGELMAGLKELPREAVERFCTRFGVERIRQLPASLTEKARGFVGALHAEYLPPPTVPADHTDPFA